MLLALALLATPRCALAQGRPALAASWSATVEIAIATASADSLAAPDAPAATAALAAFPLPRVRAWQVGLVRPDRMQHTGLSFALTSALIILTRQRGAAAGTALALGLGKERWDRRGSSGFDATDLAADVAGTSLAVMVVRARRH